MPERLCPMLASEPLGPELPPQPSEAQWRTAIRSTSLALQVPELDTLNPPSVTQELQHKGFTGFLHPESRVKAERHAIEGAMIELITDELVEEHDSEARFRALPAGDLENLLWDVEQAYGNAYDAAQYNPLSGGLRYLLRTYGPEEATDILEAMSIGTVTPVEIRNFNLYIPLLLKEHPLTQHLSEAQRIDQAHRLLSISWSKATTNMSVLEAMPSWYSKAPHATIRSRAMVGSEEPAYHVVQTDGRPLFNIPKEKLEWLLSLEPTFYCPATQRDALQRTLHAGVNAAADRGAYR